MTTRYLDPTNDVAFKRVFGDKTRLMHFINSILETDDRPAIVSLEFIPIEEVPNVSIGKRSFFDLRVKDETGKSYVIEMQNRNTDDFLKRLQLYGAFSYSNQARKGDHDNHEIMPVLVIAITRGKVFDDNVPCISFHNTVESVTGKQYLYAISYAFVELGKFHKNSEELQSLADYWLYFLAEWGHAMEPPKSAQSPAVLDAYKNIEQFNWTANQYDAYFRMQMAIDEELCELATHHKKGVAEGMAEGLLEGMAKGIEKGIEKARAEKEEMIKGMAKQGLSLEQISVIAKLSLDEITQIVSK